MPADIVGVPRERLPISVEVTVYYVVAEALANAAKHAHAAAVRIQIERLDTHVRVVVTDDGIGGAVPGSGSGLTGLADRVATLDGAFAVDSPPGQGTRVLAEIPCASS